MKWIKPEDLKRIRLAKKLLKKAGCDFEILQLKGGVYYYGTGNVAEKLMKKVKKDLDEYRINQ